jgi:predicted metal-binding protein
LRLDLYKSEQNHSQDLILKRISKKAAKKVMISDKTLCEAAKQKSGVIDAQIISPLQVETAPWVRLKCQYGCGCYGQCLVCPPFTPTPEKMREVLDSYSRAILLHCDKEADVKAIVADLEREIFLRGAWKAFGLGAGPCYFCKKCPVEEQHCRDPERARPAMEACGIDVFSTVKKFGFPLEVVRTRRQCPHYFGLLLVD